MEVGQLGTRFGGEIERSALGVGLQGPVGYTSAQGPLTAGGTSLDLSVRVTSNVMEVPGAADEITDRKEKGDREPSPEERPGAWGADAEGGCGSLHGPSAKDHVPMRGRARL